MDPACGSLKCLSPSVLQVNVTYFEITIHLQNIATGAAFLKCSNWMRLCVISSWLGYLLNIQENKAQCFMGLKILKSQFRTYQCRIFVSDYIMDGGRKTLLTMPVCKMSTEQEKTQRTQLQKPSLEHCPVFQFSLRTRKSFEDAVYQFIITKIERDFDF